MCGGEGVRGLSILGLDFHFGFICSSISIKLNTLLYIKGGQKVWEHDFEFRIVEFEE